MTDSDPSPIVVTVDQPPIGHDAALWSGALADLVRCPLRILYLAPEARHSHTGLTAARTAPDADPARERQSITGAAAAAVHRRFPDLEIIEALIEGPAAQSLAAAASGARMVVLGHPKMGTVDVFGAAFHADSVIAHTACPVTVWRGPPGQLPDHRPVILAAECADDCGAALAAFDYAHRVDAPILVLSLLPLLPEPAATDTTTLGKPTGVGASVAAARRAFPDVAVLPADLSGPEYPTTLEEQTTPAQLVVLAGVHTGPGIAIPSSRFLHHSHCPIMICPPPPPGADRSPLAAEPAPTAAEGDITIRALTADDRAVVERLHQQLSSTDAHLAVLRSPPEAPRRLRRPTLLPGLQASRPRRVRERRTGRCRQLRGH